MANTSPLKYAINLKMLLKNGKARSSKVLTNLKGQVQYQVERVAVLSKLFHDALGSCNRKERHL